MDNKEQLLNRFIADFAMKIVNADSIPCGKPFQEAVKYGKNEIKYIFEKGIEEGWIDVSKWDGKYPKSEEDSY